MRLYLSNLVQSKFKLVGIMHLSNELNWIIINYGSSCCPQEVYGIIFNKVDVINSSQNFLLLRR
jgi:hypothetical protein